MPTTPQLYAHRLGRAYGPDSSRAALAASLALPLDGIETDVCLTADERLVLLHDPLLPLGTTARGWAHERSAAEITAAHIRDSNGNPTAEHPMLLDELLDVVPESALIQLDVKAHADRRLARRTAELLCERLGSDRRRERVEVISFHAVACELAAQRGLAARLVTWADYAPHTLAAWASRIGLVGVSIEHFLLTRELVEVLRAAGLSVNTGTINHPAPLERVLELRPDAVCSDRPHELWAELPAAAGVGQLSSVLAGE